MPPSQNIAGQTPALVTVVIPAFNTERYLRRAIDSVLAQHYGAVECIVVDDGSTDRSGEIARSFGDHSYALLRQRLAGCQLRPGSLTRTALSHRHNLEVLNRIAENRPELSRRFCAQLTECRLDVYQRWASARVFHGNGSGARAVLRESRRVGKLSGYRRLWLKSYVASALKAVRDRVRPLAREDQALS